MCRLPALIISGYHQKPLIRIKGGVSVLRVGLGELPSHIALKGDKNILISLRRTQQHEVKPMLADARPLPALFHFASREIGT